MKSIDLTNVSEASEGQSIPAGGYVARIKSVEDLPQKEYLLVQLDIAEGEYKDYYQKLHDRLGANWWGLESRRSYKPAALPFFKRFCTAVSKSNGSYIFDGGRVNGDEKTLVGKLVGIILREEEYISNSGDKKTRLIIDREMSVDTIRSGKFKVPGVKLLKEDTISNSRASADNSFTNVPDGEDNTVPFA